MYLSGAKYFKRKEVEFKDLEEARLVLRITNPAYSQKSRFGNRFSKRVMPDKWLHFMEKSPIKVSSAEEEEFRIPRNYRIKYKDSNINKDIINNTISNKITSNIIFVGKLREYQEKYFLDNPGLLNDTDKVLVVSCGHGKTIISLYITTFLKEKTLVLVPTTFLRDQWKGACERFITGANVVLADSSEKTLKWKDADIYIMTLDLFTSRFEGLKKDGFFDYWGHTILDEAHRVGAESYHPYISELSGKYRTALSATFRRNDGVHIILGYHFGEQYYMPLQFDKAELIMVNTGIKIENLAKLNPTQIKYMEEFMLDIGGEYNIQGDTFHFLDSKNIEAYLNVATKEPSFTKTKRAAITSSIKKLMGFEKSPNYPLFDSYISNEPKRFRMILSMLCKLKEENRTVLVLSKRKEVLKKLDKALKGRSVKTQLIISETNVEGLGESDYVQKEAEVILGIMQLAREGMDIERLDTLVILNPIKDTEQAIGRILRFAEGKKTPHVYYICDDSNVSVGIFKSSLKFIGNNAEFKDTVMMKELLTKLEK